MQKQTRTFGPMVADLLALSDWLSHLEVTQVALESTGVYWRPVFNILEEGRTVLLVNPQHLKRVAGRKTDVQDAEWLADLLRHGLLSASFVPPAPLRDLRELTRYRKTLVQERTQEVNRLQKVLESANLKLASVASHVLGVSGRAMLEALVGGEADPQVRAELARGRLRAKLPELRRALVGRVKPHHLLLIEQILAPIAFLDQAIARLHEEIERHVPPFEEAMTLLQTLPGIKEVAAAAILAQIGPDMSRFPSAKHLASSPGLVSLPATSRAEASASVGRRPRATSGCVRSWGRSPGRLCASRGPTSVPSTIASHRLARRRGKDKAIMAVAHSVLVCIYYVLRDKRPYTDLGAGYFDQLDAARVERYHIQRLEQLGFTVTLTPQAA